MTSDQFRQVDEFFTQLCDLDPAERAALLCTIDDPIVLAEVTSLLKHVGPRDEGVETSIGAIIRAASGSGAFDDRTIGPGTRFERYRIQHKLGQGGMGDVYAAVRENDFHKQVALKIVRFGLDSDYARDRFQHERQTLAGLEHPFIARLIDGGEAGNGCPYLVLEFVDGLPIDAYCQSCSRNDILILFLKVCEAVEYAHRNLVVHRDLKPANILVTADGDPKLLDFGIAKLLDANADATRTLFAALTPQYASPEQIRREPITTASDVYSLGVVLYQLLTRRKPYDIHTTTALEMERVICHEPPASPAIGDELDHILMMALRKEPSRRYPGVLQFAQDIERYLNGHAVLAAPDTFRYRSSKFIGRHRIGIAAVAAIILALSAGLASTLYQKHRAELAQQRSERRFQDVRNLANTFLFDFHDKIAKLPGSTEAREMVVTTALKYLDQLSLEAGNDRSLLYELQSAYARTGDVQGDPTSPSLGHAEQAMKTYRKSLDIGQRLRTTGTPTLDSLEVLGTVYYRIGLLHIVAEKPQDAIPILQNGLQIAAEMQRRGKDPYILLTRCYTGLAYAQKALGDTPAALESTRQALAVEEQFAKAKPTPQTAMALAKIRLQLGEDLVDAGDLDGALKQFVSSLEGLTPLLQTDPRIISLERTQRTLINANMAAGGIEGNPLQPNLANRSTSLAYYEKALLLQQAMMLGDPKDATLKPSLANLYTAMGATIGASDPTRSVSLSRKSVAVLEDYVAITPKDETARFNLAVAHRALGLALAAQGQVQAAATEWKHAITIARSDSPDDNARFQEVLAETLILLKEHDALEEARQIAAGLWTSHPHNINMLRTLGDTYESLGDAARSSRDIATARIWYAKSHDLWKSWPQHGVSSAFDVEHVRRSEKLVAQCDASLVPRAR